MTVATFPTSVRIPGDLRQKIEAIRQDERRSLNSQILVLLEEAVASRDETRWTDAPPTTTAARPARSRTRQRPCPHRTPKGAYCKRCQRVIEE